MNYLFLEIINFILNLDFVFSQIVVAAEHTASALPSFDIRNPVAIEGGIVDIIALISNFIRGLAFIIAPAMYLWAGFQYLISGGDNKKIESAKKTIIWTTVGIIIILIAGSITSIVRSLLTA